MARTDPFDIKHIQNVEAYARKIEQLYSTAIGKLAQVGLGVPVGPGEVFRFQNATALKTRINAIFSEMAQGMEAVIYNGVKSQWNFGDQKAISQAMQGLKGVISREAFEKISAQKFGATDKALQSFLSRKDSGMGLSDRVWRYTEQFKAEMELALQVGIKEGTSARKLATEMKQYLQEPNKLFRRVRDEFGQLHLSKAAKAYNPGRGVYRSSYKNALRLTRTEVNMAYRKAENQRYQSLPFIVGFEVRLSNRHPEVDICDDLKGKYPKDFVYSGWHPQCLCHTVPILATEAEYDRMEEQLLAGKPITPINSQNAVTTLPDGFNSWIDKNKERAAGWKSQPYFIKDNFKGGKLDGGLKFATMQAETIVDASKLADMISDDKISKILNPSLPESDILTDAEYKRIVDELANDKGYDYKFEQLCKDFEQDIKDGLTEWPDFLTKEESISIYKYTQGSKRINGYYNYGKGIGDETENAILNWTKLLNHSLEKVRINRPSGLVELTRTSRVPFAEIEKMLQSLNDTSGSVFWAQEGYFSTSITKRIKTLNQFRPSTEGSRKAITFHIKSANGSTLEKLSKFPHEEEYLFKNRKKWKVVDIIHNEADDSYSVWLEDFM